jgi:GNAT superfamily N-acetyltransferase
VRALCEDDQERWRVLWDAYLAFYRAEVSEDQTTVAFRRLCAGASGMAGLVAVDADDAPVGLAHLVFHAATWSVAERCYLEDLYVDPARRGGEVAHALFDAVYELAAQRGADHVYWRTQEFNGAARSLYDTVGQLTSFVTYTHDLR